MASIFAGSSAITTERWVLPQPVPLGIEPAAPRITLILPVINAAGRV